MSYANLQLDRTHRTGIGSILAQLFHESVVSKMELEKRDFPAMIYLHYRQGKLAIDSHKILHNVFGDQAPSQKTVYNRFGEFDKGKMNFENDHRSGQPRDAVTPETVAAVKELIKADRSATYQHIQESIGIGSAAAQKIINDNLCVRKLVSRWVPRKLTLEQEVIETLPDIEWGLCFANLV